VAESLGIDMKKTFVSVLIAASLMTGCAAVSNIFARRELTTTGYARTTNQGDRHDTLTSAKYRGQIFLLLLVKDTSGFVGSSQGSRMSGQFYSPQGVEVLRWTCDSPDGKTGSVSVGAETFDLAKGGLFLVDPGQGKAVTQQLLVDMAQLQSDDIGANLKAIAPKHPQLAAFLKDFDPPPKSAP
jgi:hypothetical protein